MTAPSTLENLHKTSQAQYCSTYSLLVLYDSTAKAPLSSGQTCAGEHNINTNEEPTRLLTKPSPFDMHASKLVATLKNLF